MTKTWIEEECPDCGDEMYCKGEILDGSQVYCDCGYETGISIDEEGNSWLQQ